MNRIWLWIIGILGLLVIAALIIMVADNHRFVVREYTVSSAKVREPLTFVFVSDLHSRVYGDHNEPLLKAIDRIHPDAVLVGGDMIVSRQARAGQTGWMQVAQQFLSEIAKRYPVYMADGNHEGFLLDVEGFRSQYEAWCQMARRIGVHKLHNETVVFRKRGRDTGVRITGLDLDHETYQKIRPYNLSETAIEEKVGQRKALDDSAYTILLAHNPKYFASYAEWGADLVLAGHVHGGLLRIAGHGFIGPDLHLFPKYSGGRYETADHSCTMIVSCGLGSHTLPIRIFNPGELTAVQLTPIHLAADTHIVHS